MKSIAIALLLVTVAWPGATQLLPEPVQVPMPANVALPAWPRPVALQLPPEAAAIRSQDLELCHSSNLLGGFVVRVAGEPMAIGQTRPMLGYLAHGQLRWVDMAGAPDRAFTFRQQPGLLLAGCEFADAEGGRWKVSQRFSPGRLPGSLDVQTEVSVDRERTVAFLPMLTLFPGAASFGEKKGQGLLAGLEYVENEPSSSEADVVGPASKRQVPDSLKLTFPLMAIQTGERYLALTWRARAHFSALFDSPDRVFGSGGHVMGVLYPGSTGKNREEGSLLPRLAEVLHANEPLVLQATLLAGKGRSVVPAIQQYVALRGLPPLPGGNIDLAHYVKLTAGGWLDSQIRQGNAFRHAVYLDRFPPGRVTDAAVMMDWLAVQTPQADLVARLQQAAKAARAPVLPADFNVAGVGHVRYPVAALVYGHVAENAAHAERQARQLVGAFQPDLSVRYHAVPGGPDYAKTHYTNEANGLTSRTVMELLEAAAFCGDRELINAALQRLRALDKFRDGVPRGAQTWECPLHTPDILASAHLVRAYTLGYELSGDPEFLEQARYWAWTGVPFVYLVNPSSGAVGLYATIAVFGATNWKAPVWLGLPVQWCGLVYADALYRLVRHDPKGPWKKLADGITISGIQQSYLAEDAALQGLLPDSFVLRAQKRNPPAINPATVQACAVRYFGQAPLYDFWSFRRNGVRLHAPGEIKPAEEQAGRVSFQVQPWLNRPYFILLNGLPEMPQVAINGKKTDCVSPHQFLDKEGQLILQLEGKAEVELKFQPRS